MALMPLQLSKIEEKNLENFRSERERLLAGLSNVEDTEAYGAILEESKDHMNVADIEFQNAYSRAFDKYEAKTQEKQKEIDKQNSIRIAAHEKGQKKAEQDAKLNYPKKLEYLAIVDSYLYELKTFNPSNITDTASFDNALFKIRSYSKIFHEKNQYEFTNEEKKILSDYEVKLIAFQKKVLPQIRKTYGVVVQQKGWEHNIEGRTFGDGFRILEISSFYFTDNGNIKQVMDALLPIVQELRFNEVRFKWSKKADEYQVYKHKPASDGDIIVMR